VGTGRETSIVQFALNRSAVYTRTIIVVK